MRTSTAYFAGVGTVMVAVAAGLGGGYLAANIVSPPTQAVSKLERSVGPRKTSPEPMTVARAAAEPVPYVAPNDVKDVTSPAATPAPPQIEAQPQPQQPPSQLPVQTEATAPANEPASEEKTAEVAAPTPPAPPPVQPPSPKVVDAKPAEKPEQKSVSSRDSYAKAADAEVKRAAVERRRAERRQQAAERRQQPSREQDLDVVEARIREVTEPRRMRGRDEAEARDFAGPARSESPRIRLFDLDD